IADALSRASYHDKNFTIKESAIEAQVNLEKLVQETQIDEGLDELLIELGIPKSMRPQMIHRLHCNHMGITETQLKANELIFWPNKEIADIVRNCLACLTFENFNQKGPLTIKDIPTSPW
ncbi:hypothetical protein ILUMI_14885, partial [Ignelater luminosus]